VNCQNQKITGVHHDGGYAEVTIAKANGLISVPDDLSSVDGDVIQDEVKKEASRSGLPMFGDKFPA
jgi:hypothetical protein